MKDTVVIVSKVLPVILLIILGNVFRKSRFIRQSTIDELKKIIVNISLPALLFMAFAGTSFEGRYGLIFLSVFLVCGLMLLLGTIFKSFLNSNNRYLPSLFSGFETGMMGYSLFVAVYGAANMYKLALIDLGQVTFVFFILVTYLQKINGKSSTINQIVLSFLKSPVILAILSGILVGSLGLLDAVEAYPLSNSILETLKLLSNLTVPVICVVIGYELHIDPQNLGRPLLTALIRVLLLLGIAFLISELLIERIMHLDHTFKIALYTMFLLPPPFVIPIFMEAQEVENKRFILNTISIHIVLSLAAFLVLILVM
ncbi:MAG: permease [Clostridia bacterium]|nr:permease [Clostridia bacterium]